MGTMVNTGWRDRLVHVSYNHALAKAVLAGTCNCRCYTSQRFKQESEQKKLMCDFFYLDPLLIPKAVFQLQ